MEYEKLCCEECIVYKVRHQLDNPDKCYKCGNMSMYWKQNEYGTMGGECSECGASFAVDMNTPCELEYNSMFRCHIPAEQVSREKLLVISKFVNMTAIETMKKIKTDGIDFEENFYGMCSQLISMDKLEISYVVEPYDPRYKYTYIKECGYPYRAIREDW